MLGKPTTSTGDTSASFADGTYELQVYEPGYVTQFQNETISGAAKSVTITLSTFVTQTPSYPTPIRHVIVIMDENLENNTALAEPYQGSLAKNYGYAANFWSAAHNSGRDYVAASSGNSTTNLNLTGTDLANLLDAKGESWAEYEEAMPGACDVNYQTVPNSLYSVGHNPFVHFQEPTAVSHYCRQHELVFNETAFETNLSNGILDSYSWITPDLCDDAHGTNASGACPIGAATDKAADTWLSNLIPKIISSPLWSSTAVFILYDEGATGAKGDDRPYGTGGGHIYSVAVSDHARTGDWSQMPYDTYSILTTTEWLLGLGRTGLNDSWTVHPPMYDLFNFNSTYSITGTVTSSTGGTIPGANITNQVFNWSSANSEGVYSLTAPNNTYVLSAWAPGYHAETQTVVVKGSSKTLNFVLTPLTTSSYTVPVEVHAKNGTDLSGVSVAYSGPTSGTMPLTNASGGTSVKLTDGTYELTASLTGFTTAYANVTVANQNPAVTTITLPPVQTGPPPTFKLTFHVVSAVTGSGIGGAWVNSTQSGKTVTCGAPTSSSGYTSCNMANGTYAFTISAIGYVPQAVNVTVSGTTVAPSVKLVKAVTVSSYPVSVEVRSQNGTALSGVSVWYSGPTSGTMPLTNASGGTMAQLTNGTYELTASLTGYTTNSTNVTVAGKNVNVAITLTPIPPPPPPTYTVTLHVVNAANGSAIAGAWANLTEKGKLVACGPPTSASGNTSCSLANGTYPFTISANGFVTQNVNITVSGTTTAPTIRLVKVAPPPTYVVSVEVRSKNGTAVSGASVSYSGTTSGTMPSTNATGGTSVTLGNGTYRFTASLTGFNTNSTNGTVAGNNLNIPITLTPTQTVPPPTYKLTFHVETSAGANLAGAWVNRTVSGKNVTCGSPTSSSGYSSCDLANGTYTFTISAKGYVSQTETLTVSGTTVAPVGTAGAELSSEQSPPRDPCRQRRPGRGRAHSMN